MPPNDVNATRKVENTLMQETERKSTLTLLLVPGIGHGLVTHMLDVFGSAYAATQVSGQQLSQLPRVTRQRADQIRQAMDRILENEAVEQEFEQMAAKGVSLVLLSDPEYPKLLRHIPDPPVALWVHGRFEEDDALSLAIVGSRRCSLYGREQSQRFAYQCAQAGLCIVSGGAYGIDAAAHRGALQATGRTIAVIGSGLSNPYPKDHNTMFDEIVGEGGAVVSELPMDTPPQAENFPRRNRIISGLALGVLVVEAAMRSGALITARLCVEDHGRELMAVPGRLDSKTSDGCHKMIREGWARLVTNAADVLDGLGEAGQLLKVGLLETSDKQSAADDDDLHLRGLNQTQKKMMAVLAESCTLDQLVSMTELPVHEVQSELTMLEIRGLVRRDSGLFTARKAGQFG